ncbi:hypothetical protein ACFL1B_01035 [Nanoarchaeota archaeon]
MTQNFMYKRVNIFLLILMCLIVIGLAASAVYFQESFKSLNNNYESVLTNFTTCSDVLNVKENKLDACIDDLNSSARDIGVYDTIYDQKVDQLKKTQDELMLTDRELKNTKLELANAQSQYQQELQRVTDMERQIASLRQDIIRIQEYWDDCKDSVCE